MDKKIPYGKLQKKQQQQIAAEQRGSWGSMQPVTRKVENKKAYNRKRARQWRDQTPMTVL